MMLYHTTAAHFDEVLEESRTHPVLLDFYAGWCAPCRALEPQLDALTDAYEDVVFAYSVNTDTDAEIAERFGVDKLPAVLLLSGDTEQRWEASVRISDIEEALAELRRSHADNRTHRSDAR